VRIQRLSLDGETSWRQKSVIEPRCPTWPALIHHKCVSWGIVSAAARFLKRTRELIGLVRLSVALAAGADCNGTAGARFGASSNSAELERPLVRHQSCWLRVITLAVLLHRRASSRAS